MAEIELIDRGAPPGCVLQDPWDDPSARDPPPSRVSLLDADGKVLAEGASGDSLTVPPGVYRLEAQLLDPADAVDRPSRTEEVRLEARQQEQLEISIVRRWVHFIARRDGKRVEAILELHREGEAIAEIRLTGTAAEKQERACGRCAPVSCRHRPISVGEHYAVVIVAGERHPMTVQVPPGGPGQIVLELPAANAAARCAQDHDCVLDTSGRVRRAHGAAERQRRARFRPCIDGEATAICRAGACVPMRFRC